MSSKGEKKAEADAGVAELGAPAGALRCQVYGQAFGRLKLSKKDLQVRTSLVCICAGGANSKSGPLVPPTLVPLQPWRWLKLKVARLRSRPVTDDSQIKALRSSERQVSVILARHLRPSTPVAQRLPISLGPPPRAPAENARMLFDNAPEAF